MGLLGLPRISTTMGACSNSVSSKQMCLAWVIVTSGIFLEASYMGISSNFGVLYGSVYTLLCRTDFIEKGMTK